jgi:glutathione synthase/RimK-type ligase-like ATP-grasp enzyme
MNKKNSKKIIYIAKGDDDNANYIYQKTKEKQVNTIFIDTQKFPLEYDSYIYLDDIKRKIKIGNYSDINSEYSFFIRAIAINVFNPFNYSSDEKKFHSYKNYYSFLYSLVNISKLNGAKVVNSPSTFWIHFYKPYTYALAKKFNLKIPQTFVANKSREILKFYKENKNKELVVKPVAGGDLVRILNEEELEKIKNTLDYKTFIIQERIKGKELRVFVLGNKILVSLYLITPDLDYREKQNIEDIKIIDISKELENSIIKFSKWIGLEFCALDFKKSNDNYYFLDINPAPMFVGFETKSSFPITDKIIQYLLK